VITVSTFYLTAQMVGGGVLVKTLIGIDYEVSVIAVGVLMLAYVVFGGMGHHLGADHQGRAAGDRLDSCW
jgi:Na+(H+)/acetate symporter ActP